MERERVREKRTLRRPSRASPAVLSPMATPAAAEVGTASMWKERARRKRSRCWRTWRRRRSGRHKRKVGGRLSSAFIGLWNSRGRGRCCLLPVRFSEALTGREHLTASILVDHVTDEETAETAFLRFLRRPVVDGNASRSDRRRCPLRRGGNRPRRRRSRRWRSWRRRRCGRRRRGVGYFLNSAFVFCIGRLLGDVEATAGIGTLPFSAAFVDGASLLLRLGMTPENGCTSGIGRPSNSVARGSFEVTPLKAH